MAKHNLMCCKICGSEMARETSGNPGNYTESPAYMGERWPICCDCMIEHCNYTNCYGCNYGKYPDCRFISLKKHRPD
jgi:hypothetical protein